MKVIAGKYKSKKIATKLKRVSPDIRPTTSMIREAVFNVIYSYIVKNNLQAESCSFLDICCGTGAVGIEALSRNFKIVHFVDKNPDSVTLTQHNISNIVTDSTNSKQYKVIKSDASKLNVMHQLLYDFIYLDPPYNYNINKIKLMLNNISKFIHSKSLIILETSKNLPITRLDCYRTIASKKYTNCLIVFMIKT
jgi:16S rRNA (guanine966-N2)-methyltransferase